MRLSRRALFAGTASLALAPAAQAPPTRDAELTALGADFEQARGVQRAAQRHLDACEARYLAQCPDVPVELTGDGPLGQLLVHQWDYWTARELCAFLRDPDNQAEWPAARATLAIAIANVARERRLWRKLGLAAAERAADAIIWTRSRQRSWRRLRARARDSPSRRRW